VNTSTVVIIGYGVVGKNMHKLFPNADIHDPRQNITATKPFYDVGFICVPTDMTEDGKADISIVEEVVWNWHQRTRALCIKSTVPPETTALLSRGVGKNLVFSPEFFGSTQHANGVDYNFVILGGESPEVDIISELYKEVKTGNFHIHNTKQETAELVKYAENSFLAMKVTFFNEFYRVAKNLGVNIDEFRELLLLDPRIGRSHTFTYRKHPYYQSHCFDKDLPAIIQYAKTIGVEMDLIKAVVLVNDQMKKEVEEQLSRHQ
jgi:UDPglucose 6-dehydrogenase